MAKSGTGLVLVDMHMQNIGSLLTEHISDIKLIQLCRCDDFVQWVFVLVSLQESWPINTYPFLTVLPTGSVLIIAGIPQLCCFAKIVRYHSTMSQCHFDKNVS